MSFLLKTIPFVAFHALLKPDLQNKNMPNVLRIWLALNEAVCCLIPLVMLPVAFLCYLPGGVFYAWVHSIGFLIFWALIMPVIASLITFRKANGVVMLIFTFSLMPSALKEGSQGSNTIDERIAYYSKFDAFKWDKNLIDDDKEAYLSYVDSKIKGSYNDYYGQFGPGRRDIDYTELNQYIEDKYNEDRNKTIEWFNTHSYPEDSPNIQLQGYLGSVDRNFNDKEAIPND